MAIIGNAAGASMLTPKSMILIDENGVEMVGVVVGEETVLTATDNDVREGSVYAGDTGVSTGTKVIPLYHTCQGFKIVTSGDMLTIPNNMPTVNSYDYTKLQAIVCTFNTNVADSVSAEKVSIDDAVYNVQSTEPISSVIKNHDAKIVEMGITNDTDTMMIIRFFMYKEIK